MALVHTLLQNPGPHLLTGLERRNMHHPVLVVTSSKTHHAFKRYQSGLSQVLRHVNLRLQVSQRVSDLLQGIETHMGTFVACTGFIHTGQRQEGTVQRGLFHLVENTGLSTHNEGIRFRFFCGVS